MRVFIYTCTTIPSVDSFNDIFLSYLSICNLYSAADRDKPSFVYRIAIFLFDQGDV